ncbi:MAG TPA: VTT domain-containing protein [Microthrixaceae bacterium]|nr:VTT domain-containing protein [Microthrixaceae bacterium]
MFALLEFLDPEKLIDTVGLIGIFAIVFAESGLLVGFFLPGDSLLFTAGMFAGGAFASRWPDIDFNIVVLCAGVFIAAVLGDQVGYLFGRKVGPSIFKRPDSRLFKHENVEKAQGFFDRYGPKAIVLARFVPVVRTFTPVIAGVSHMDYPVFARFNVVGGLLWGVGVTLLGYFFGGIEIVQENFEVAILAVVAISFLPIFIEFVRHRRRGAAVPAGDDAGV